MKTIDITKKIQALVVVSVSLFALIGCGGGDTKWGIDHGANTIEVASCDLAAGNNGWTSATLVEAGTTVTPLTDDTQLRVWHFQNSQEYVCTLNGQATIAQPTTGA